MAEHWRNLLAALSAARDGRTILKYCPHCRLWVRVWAIDSTDCPKCGQRVKEDLA